MTVSPKICVVIPAYNHEKYIAHAIRSVEAQDLPDIELRILDDGSTDATLSVAESTISRCEAVTGFVDTQTNCGVASTLNRLIDSVDADYIAILNSDDVYNLGRLKAFLEAAENTKLFFGFTGVEFQNSAMISDYLLFDDWYRSKYAFSCAMPTCGFAILASNIAITSSNFFFSREIFDLAGGFEPNLTLTVDWQFAIKTLQWTEPYLVPKRLLKYRVHDDNTYRKLQDSRIEQSKRALDAFVDWVEDRTLNPIAPTHLIWPRFFQYFARTCAPAFSTDPIGRFLPDHILQAAHAEKNGANTVDDEAVMRLITVSRELQSQPLQSADIYLERAAEVWGNSQRQVGE